MSDPNATKQVIVLRKDLNMRKGKMVAQGAHASMKVFFDRKQIHRAHNDDVAYMHIGMDLEMFEWVEGSFAKICVSVSSEEELLEVYRNAKDAGLPCALVKDSGKTEFNGVPTHTAVAVGPARSHVIDKITGHLTLL